MTQNTKNMNQDMKQDITELLNDIYKVEGDSLLDRIIGYCEKSDLDVREIGDLISDNDELKRKIWLDCVKHNIIMDLGAERLLNQTEDPEIW